MPEGIWFGENNRRRPSLHERNLRLRRKRKNIAVRKSCISEPATKALFSLAWLSAFGAFVKGVVRKGGSAL
jgi:hypothetical protein